MTMRRLGYALAMMLVLTGLVAVIAVANSPPATTTGGNTQIAAITSAPTALEMTAEAVQGQFVASADGLIADDTLTMQYDAMNTTVTAAAPRRTFAGTNAVAMIASSEPFQELGPIMNYTMMMTTPAPLSQTTRTAANSATAHPIIGA